MRTLAILALVAVGVATFLWRGQVVSSTSVVSTQGEVLSNPDFIQIDDQNGVKVVATYLPSASTETTAAFGVTLTSDSVDLSSYEASREIILADDQVEPLRTLNSSYTTRTRREVKMRMSFQRVGSHHHLIVRNLAGIKDRLLHFYLGKS